MDNFSFSFETFLGDDNTSNEAECHFLWQPIKKIGQNNEIKTEGERKRGRKRKEEREKKKSQEKKEWHRHV